jgi:hypothetical protein
LPTIKQIATPITFPQPPAGYCSIMALRPKDAAYITTRAARHLRWLDRLIQRLQAHQVKPSDPLMLSATETRNAMHALRVHAMYRAMPPGTAGRAEDDTPKP